MATGNNKAGTPQPTYSQRFVIKKHKPEGEDSKSRPPAPRQEYVSHITRAADSGQAILSFYASPCCGHPTLS